MCYTYVLRSDHDQRFYTGTTRDLRAQVKVHAEGKVRSTAYRRPLTLVYFEACLNADDAYRRERAGVTLIADEPRRANNSIQVHHLRLRPLKESLDRINLRLESLLSSPDSVQRDQGPDSRRQRNHPEDSDHRDDQQLRKTDIH